jgi:2-polyprenyl-3-methyl-5-hydroxy-6-metoxy-1,4-benzoquinol methylase
MLAEMSTACPICFRPSPRLGWLPAAHELHRCQGCGHVWARASQAQLDALYSAAYDGFREDRVFEAGVRRLFEEQIVPRAARGSTLLDVGCGNGTVLQVASALGYRAKGVDFSRAAVDLCRGRGLDAEVMDFTKHDFRGERFDVVMFWDVLEHLVEPASFIDAAARALGPGGWLLVKVPHHRRLSIELSATVPRLSRSVLSTPAHLQFFTQASLAKLFAPAFDRVEWLAPPRRLRSEAMGGPLRRRVSRRLVSAIRGASGDGTLLALARKAA